MSWSLISVDGIPVSEEKINYSDYTGMTDKEVENLAVMLANLSVEDDDYDL